MNRKEYLDQMKDDIIEVITNEYEPEDLKDKSYDDWYDILFVDDSVTGNASGSYTFNSAEAKDNIDGAEDVMQDAIDDFGIDKDTIVAHLTDPEYWDVTIRCYLLGEALESALKEIDVVDDEEEKTEKNGKKPDTKDTFIKDTEEDEDEDVEGTIDYHGYTLHLDKYGWTVDGVDGEFATDEEAMEYLDSLKKNSETEDSLTKKEKNRLKKKPSLIKKDTKKVKDDKEESLHGQSLEYQETDKKLRELETAIYEGTSSTEELADALREITDNAFDDNKLAAVMKNLFNKRILMITKKMAGLRKNLDSELKRYKEFCQEMDFNPKEKESWDQYLDEYEMQPIADPQLGMKPDLIDLFIDEVIPVYETAIKDLREGMRFNSVAPGIDKLETNGKISSAEHKKEIDKIFKNLLGDDLPEEVKDYKDFCEKHGFNEKDAKALAAYNKLKNKEKEPIKKIPGDSETESMTREDIIDTIIDLSYSQGFYGRLLRKLKEIEKNNPKQYEEIMRTWEARHFKDPVDFVLYIES